MGYISPISKNGIIRFMLYHRQVILQVTSDHYCAEEFDSVQAVTKIGIYND